jgi:hypothetical protein
MPEGMEAMPVVAETVVAEGTEAKFQYYLAWHGEP